MRPAAFSDEDVIEAGKLLLSQGRTVTGSAIRSKLGGGNIQRLSTIWKEYQRTQVDVAKPEFTEMPVELAEQIEEIRTDFLNKLTGVALGLHTKANQAAERRVTELVRSTNEARAQSDQELSDAANTVDELEGLLEAAKARETSLLAELDKVDDARQQAAVDLARAEQQIAGHVDRYKELAAQLDDVRTAGERALKDLAAEHAERQKQNTKELEEARRTGQMARDEHKQALGNLQAAERQHVEDVEVISRLRLSENELNQSLTRALAQLESLQKSAEEAKASADAAVLATAAAEKRALVAEAKLQALQELKGIEGDDQAGGKAGGKSGKSNKPS